MRTLIALLALIAMPAHAAERQPPSITMPIIQCQEAIMSTIHRVDPAIYVLNAGDILLISLSGAYNESLVQMISADGKIAIPVLGIIVIADLTINQAEALIQKRTSIMYKGVTAGIAVHSLRRTP